MNDSVGWEIDPDDPRAPPTEVWERLSEAQRAAVVDALPSEFPVSEANPPEGDVHQRAVDDVRAALRRWYREEGRTIYVAGNLPVYYPGESMFSPDIIAVAGAEQRDRHSWIVDAEGGRGLDVAIEIVVRGSRKKDLERNVAYYAQLGIPEYYLFDRRNLTLAAWELRGRAYRQRSAPDGVFPSPILGLDISLDGERLRFTRGGAPVPFIDELLARVEGVAHQAHRRVEELEERLAAEQRLREEEQRLREEEQRLREEEQRLREEERASLEAEVARLRAELERLRSSE